MEGIFFVFEIAELLEGRPIIYKSLAAQPILSLYPTYFTQMAENCWKKKALTWLKSPLHRPWVKGCKYCSPQENVICTLGSLRWTAWPFLSTAISRPPLFYPPSNRLQLWLLQGTVFHLQLGIQFQLIRFNLEIIGGNSRGKMNSWSGRNHGRSCLSQARGTEEGNSRQTAMEGAVTEMNCGAW